MYLSRAKRQTAFLTCINGVVRAMGFAMRVLLSRTLGAEIMGVMELAQSVHMVAIAPLTSGLPAAISRMTAKACAEERAGPLQAGLWLTRVASAALIPLLWLFSPAIARISGEIRILPSLWFTAPCILILGYSAAYNGYCYGIGQGQLPALSELLEQGARMAFTFLLLGLLHGLTVPWLAAIPAVATMLAELLGLIWMMKRLSPLQPASGADFRRPVFHLAAPTSLTRLFQTGLRSLTSILIPLRLQQSGLCAAEATARLGMLNGMVLPVAMLPLVFTSALSMVALPRIAQAEKTPAELKRLVGKCLLGCAEVALAASAAVYVAAGPLSVKVFRVAELAPLFRLCAPLTLLMAVSHLLGSVLTALGQQKRTFFISCFVSIISLGFTWFWAGVPELRLMGVIRAQYVSHALLAVLSAGLLLHWMLTHAAADDKCA